MHTSTHGGELYLKNGSLYHGAFKIDLAEGGSITDSGEELYYKNGKPTKNPSSIPYGVIERRKQKKIQERQSRRRRR